MCLIEGAPSNPWLVGVEGAASVVADMIEKAKGEVGMLLDQPLQGLGLCMSGMESREKQDEFRAILVSKSPNASSSIELLDDTMGSLATVTPGAGICLIAGTGSSCRYVSNSGDAMRTGGWGHQIGDGGSAFDTARYVISLIYRVEDGFYYEHDVSRCGERMRTFFQLENRMAILPWMYSEFKKDSVAAFAKELAILAEEGDIVARGAFHRCGVQLAEHVLAILPRVEEEVLSSPNGLHVVCVGGMWNSWKWIRPGFDAMLTSSGETYPVRAAKLVLNKLIVDSCSGAAFLGAKNAGFLLPLSYDNVGEMLGEWHKP
jgi:N-acetylglucosamine kinase-like BadF-type ATPase